MTITMDNGTKLEGDAAVQWIRGQVREALGNPGGAAGAVELSEADMANPTNALSESLQRLGGLSDEAAAIAAKGRQAWR